MAKRIAITGMGLVTPFGIGNDIFKQKLNAGMSAITPLTLFDSPLDTPTRVAEVKDFDPKPILGRKGLRNYDRMTLMLLVAGELLTEDMDFMSFESRREHFADEEISLVLGSMGSLKSISDFDLETIHEPKYVRPGHFPNTVFCAAASYAAIRGSIKESCVTLTNDEPSGLYAFGYGIDHLLSGRVKMAVVGATEELSPIYIQASLRYAEVQGFNTPILAEGAQIFAMELMDHAQARGAKVYGEVLGHSSCFCPDLQQALDHNIDQICEQVGSTLFEEISHVFCAHKDIEETKGSLSRAVVHSLYKRFGYLCSMSGTMPVAVTLSSDEIAKDSLVLINNLSDSGTASSMLIRKLVA